MIGVFRGVALGAIVRKVGASRRGAPNQPGFIARRTPRMPDPLSPAPHTPIYPDLPPREEMTTGGGPEATTATAIETGPFTRGVIDARCPEPHQARMADWFLSIAMLAVIALLLGAAALWRRGERRKGVLMAVAALVIAGNVAISTIPVPAGSTPAGTVPAPAPT
eukprot:gene5678-5740_t